MTEMRITGAWRLPQQHQGPRPILVVEDSPVQRLNMKLLLEGFGYLVREAEDGQQAREAMRTAPPHAVLLDWELPDAKGLELLLEWAADPALRWVPVLMITSHDDSAKVKAALDGGAADYVRKPPDATELHARLRSALRLRDLQEQMRHLAQRDALTGLWNRGVAIDRLQRTLAGKGSAPALQISVGLVDVDHFKGINDTHGHDVGDVVLQQMARHLERHLGEHGTVARFGGEEFLVVMPDVGRVKALSALERTRKAAEGTAWGDDTTPLRVTFSAGLAHAETGAGVLAKDLLKRADLALYAAKEAGRNRIELAR